MPVGVDPPDEAVGEGVGLALGVGPQHVVPELVVDGLDPLALGVVFPASLPVLRMDQVDLAVLVAAAADPSPVEILEPFHLRWPQVVETAERLDRAPELELAMGAKEAGELSVYGAAFPYARNNHAHRCLDLAGGQGPRALHRGVRGLGTSHAKRAVSTPNIRERKLAPERSLPRGAAAPRCGRTRGSRIHRGLPARLSASCRIPSSTSRTRGIPTPCAAAGRRASRTRGS